MSIIQNYLKLVKFAHTIFALPFALIGFTMGVLYLNSQGLDIQILKFLFIVLICMISARNAAMGFNRYLDRDIDAANPRTRDREIPKGTISAKSALLFVVFNSIIFIIAAAFLSKICFYLSPLALFILLIYSYIKRVSSLCHFVLGLALSIAPLGAFIALSSASGQLVIWGAIISLATIVLLWVSSFDILYSLSDEDFDKKHNLNSIPVLLRRKRAMNLSLWLHLIILPLLVLLYFQIFSQQSPILAILDPNNLIISKAIFIISCLIFAGLLIFQHCIISSTNLRRLNAAFFTTNGIASILFSIGVISSLII